MKKICIFLLILCGWNTQLICQNENSYKIIYEADSDGNTIIGDLEKLLEYVQTGNPLRVGWILNFQHPQTKEVIEMQHWTDAGFITTLNGHVFAQIRGIFQQGPNLDMPPSVFLGTDKPNSWVAIIGTTGMMRQKFDSSEMIASLNGSGMSEEEVENFLKEQESRKVSTKWAVQVK